MSIIALVGEKQQKSVLDVLELLLVELVDMTVAVGCQSIIYIYLISILCIFYISSSLSVTQCTSKKLVMPKSHYSWHVLVARSFTWWQNRFQGHLISSEIWCFHHTIGSITPSYRCRVKCPCPPTVRGSYATL